MQRIFRFKNFSLTDQNSSMKIGTDAVLLGIFSAEKDFDNALDIGTGCGIISLILAQNCKGNILGIDIDKESISDAEKNFQLSAWSNKLSAENISLQDFLIINKKKFDKIVCNPPYFNNGILSEDLARASARHSINLDLHILSTAVKALLSKNGFFDVILPLDMSIELKKEMLSQNMYTYRELDIYTFRNSGIIRKAMSFSHVKPFFPKISKIIIRENAELYTQEYYKYTEKFYLNLPTSK